jgi:threonine/homoserine/homoserine lactone efflux protein
MLISLIADVPIGPVNLEIIRRVLNRHKFSAFFFAIGASVADGLWPLVSFLGLSPLLEIRLVASIFWGAASLLLFYLGISFIHEARKNHFASSSILLQQKQHLAFFSGFALVVSNPTNLVIWVAVIGFFHNVGILPEVSYLSAFILWFSVALGSLIYFSTIILLVNHHHKLFSGQKQLGIIKIIFGCFILLLAGYFSYLFLNIFIC